MESTEAQNPALKVTIYYDGECPFCSAYVRYTRLKDDSVQLTLHDVRNHPEKISEFNEQGLNIDEGMIVNIGDGVFHGADAMNALALISTASNPVNRLNRWLFTRRRLAKIVYPAMVAGRNLILLILGRSKINPR